MEELASGFGLLEGPTVDLAGGVYFSDVMGGGVYRWSPEGVEQVVPKRRGVGGIVLHEDGGLVVTGRDVVHVREGDTRVLLEVDGVTGFNDLGTAADGSVYVGSLRFMPFRGEAPVPAEIWRIPVQGDVAPVAGGVLWANGIGFSPDGTVAYGSDYARSCVLAWDVAADGSLTSPRTFAEMPAGSADGMAVDSEGGVWVATGEAATVARFTADGSLDRTLDVPWPHSSRAFVSEARTCATSSSPQGTASSSGPAPTLPDRHSRRRACSQPGPQQRRHALRLLENLPPRDAQHVPSRQLEIEVPLPVLLEGERVGVEAAAVGLHYQPVVWPMEVHLVGENEAVDHGHWEARVSQQLQEESLELAAGEGRLVGDLGEDAPQRAGAGSSARPLERSIHRR